MWLGYGVDIRSFRQDPNLVLNFRFAQGGGALIVFALAVIYKCRTYILCGLFPQHLKGVDPDERKELQVSSAVFMITSLALIVSYRQVADAEILKRGLTGISMDLSLINPSILAGLFIGGMLPFAFSSMTMNAVGRAAAPSAEAETNETETNETDTNEAPESAPSAPAHRHAATPAPKISAGRSRRSPLQPSESIVTRP